MSSASTLSRRGQPSLRPALSYLEAFFNALQNPSKSGPDEEDDNGYICLTVAENALSFDLLRPLLKEAEEEPLDPGTENYDNMSGRLRFRTAVAKFMERTIFHRPVSPDSIVVSSGCGALCESLSYLLADEGDIILIPAPYYPAFDNDLTVRARVVPVPVPFQFIPEDDGESQTDGEKNSIVKGRWHLNSSILEDYRQRYAAESTVSLTQSLSLSPRNSPSNSEINAPTSHRGSTSSIGCNNKGTGRVRVVLLTSPNNPTGHIYTEEELRDIIEWGRKNEVHIVVDEIYAHSVYNLSPLSLSPSTPNLRFTSAGEMYKSPAEVGDYLHILYGFSKDFCMSGFRVGILYSENIALLRAMGNVNYFAAISNYAQQRLSYMLEQSPRIDSYLSANLQNIRKSYEIIQNTLHSLNIPYTEPLAGMFVWMDLSELLPAERTTQGERVLWQSLYEHTRILFTPGGDCHAATPGWFRVCFVYVERYILERAMRRLREWVERRREEVRREVHSVPL